MARTKTINRTKIVTGRNDLFENSIWQAILGGIGWTTHAKNALNSTLEPAHSQYDVLRFWGKMTMPNAGTMLHRRDFPSTTRI